MVVFGYSHTVDGRNPKTTTWDVWNPVNTGINYLSTGAGFLPSTVSPLLVASLNMNNQIGNDWSSRRKNHLQVKFSETSIFISMCFVNIPVVDRSDWVAYVVANGIWHRQQHHPCHFTPCNAKILAVPLRSDTSNSMSLIIKSPIKHVWPLLNWNRNSGCLFITTFRSLCCPHCHEVSKKI